MIQIECIDIFHVHQSSGSSTDCLTFSYRLKTVRMATKLKTQATVKTKKIFPSPESPLLKTCCKGKKEVPCLVSAVVQLLRKGTRTAAKLVNQFTGTPMVPAAVLAWLGTHSASTAHGSGARPILKLRTKPTTAIPDNAWEWMSRPIPRRRVNRAVPAIESNKSRLVPNDCDMR